MRAVDNEAYRRFAGAADEPAWKGQRIKERRYEVLTPGGRTRLTLFEQVDGEGRPNPRLQVEMPPAADPAAKARLYHAPASPLTTAAALRTQVEEQLASARPALDCDGLDLTLAPKGSERYYRNSIRAQRIARFFAEARAAVADWTKGGALPAGERKPCARALAELEARTYAGEIAFDNADTGTYHSYRHDAPFVHHLERTLASLPAADSSAFALLPDEQQAAVRRQRTQAQAHLDHLMRHKYARNGIRETDIERSLGGLLIDRASRDVVSESPASAGSLVPAYELLRIDPAAAHPKAGASIYRDGKGGFRLQDGSPVEVPAAAVRATPIDDGELTFRRELDDGKLRENVRFAWEGRGYVQAGDVSWISWAGHCDIKAVMEQLGIALVDGQPMKEHRSDTGATVEYDRALQIEMIACVLELGSVYRVLDGDGQLQRGISNFGGARNDSLPDRLQFQGQGGPGKSFRWPLSGRQETFTITGIDWGEGPADLNQVFFRYLADATAIDFKENPRFLKTVEGDFDLIDVSGAKLDASVEIDVFDPATGYPQKERRSSAIDLRPAAAERCLLGTQMKDAAKRQLYRVYFDPKAKEIVAELDEYRLADQKWTAHPIAAETVRIPLATPFVVTLSREMTQDDPELFQALLDAAIRKGENINADTSARADVWNGTITRIESTLIASNPTAPVERWKVVMNARFGSAELGYLVRRDEEGTPVAYCPLRDDSAWSGPPDFLWQDFPDVGSKGHEENAWIINESMVERDLVELRPDPAAPGGVYVQDDHVKNLFEQIYCALAGYSYTIVHGNKRHGFKDQVSWQAAIDLLAERKKGVTFTAAAATATA